MGGRWFERRAGLKIWSGPCKDRPEIAVRSGAYSGFPTCQTWEPSFSGPLPVVGWQGPCFQVAGLGHSMVTCRWLLPGASREHSRKCRIGNGGLDISIALGPAARIPGNRTHLPLRSEQGEKGPKAHDIDSGRSACLRRCITAIDIGNEAGFGVQSFERGTPRTHRG
jgi:hypothetical protein